MWEKQYYKSCMRRNHLVQMKLVWQWLETQKRQKQKMASSENAQKLCVAYQLLAKWKAYPLEAWNKRRSYLYQQEKYEMTIQI